MDATTENNIRQEQIESFGRLMAGFAHDMKNHLGIIRESNGLMGDIIEMGGLGDDEITVERFKKSIASIERRVIIAANMFHHLSGFAHRPDTPYSSFQVNDLIAEEYVFLERFSRLKQIDLVLELGDGLPALYNDPALLQHVFYRLYVLCLEQLSNGLTLVILTSRDEKKGVITFHFPGTLQGSLEQPSTGNIQAAVKKLEGILEISDNEEGYTDIRLTIPSLSVD